MHRLRHPADREIVRLAFPALGALAAEPLYLLVDTAVVGHLGTAQLGGLAVAGTILTTSYFLFNFLAYGTTAAVARATGAGRDDEVASQGAQSMWLALAIGVALAVVGTAFAPHAVRAFGAQGDVAVHAALYLRVSAIGAPAVLVMLAGAGFLRGVQDTRTTLLVAVGSNVVNLILEVWLVYGLDRGIGASAGATVVAQFGGAIAYAIVVARRVRAAGAPVRPDLARLRRLVIVGRDLFVRTGALLGALAVATAVASRIGDVSLAAHQVAFQLWSFLALVLDAIAIAGQAIVGRALGAGDADGARSSSRRMVEWGIAAGLAFTVLILALRPALAPLFSGDDRVVDAAFEVLLVVALLQPLNAIVFVLDGVLIGAGDARFLAGAMVASALAFAAAIALVVALGGGLIALWGAIAVLMTTRLIGNASRFASGKWAVVG